MYAKSFIFELTHDEEPLQFTFEKYDLLPVYEKDRYSMNNAVHAIRVLCENSPSHTSIIEGVGGRQSYIFTGIEQDTNLDIALRLRNISLDYLTTVLRDLDSEASKCGNVWLKIEVGVMDGKISVTPIPLEQCLYVRAKKGTKVRTCVWANTWDENKWGDNPPEVNVVSTPLRGWNWKRRGGSYHTVLHIRKGRRNQNSMYDAPMMLPALRSYVTESNTHTATAITSGIVTATENILAWEEADKKSRKTPDKAADNWNKHDKKVRQAVTVEFTDSGDGHGKQNKAVGVFNVEYPNGVKPPTLIKLGVNRDYKYSAESLKTAEAVIYSIWGWSPILTSRTEPKGGINGNVILDIETQKNKGVILPEQRWWATLLQDILQNCFAVSGSSFVVPEINFINEI